MVNVWWSANVNLTGCPIPQTKIACKVHFQWKSMGQGIWIDQSSLMLTCIMFNSSWTLVTVCILMFSWPIDFQCKSDIFSNWQMSQIYFLWLIDRCCPQILYLTQNIPLIIKVYDSIVYTWLWFPENLKQMWTYSPHWT